MRPLSLILDLTLKFCQLMSLNFFFHFFFFLSFSGLEDVPKSWEPIARRVVDAVAKTRYVFALALLRPRPDLAFAQCRMAFDPPVA
jgi:hypothetical protein